LYAQKKVGYLGFSNDSPNTLENKFTWVGLNSGNLIFDHALKKLLDAELIPIDRRNEYDADDYKSLITTAFIWILPNDPRIVDWHKALLAYAKNKPLIPISVGLQCHIYSKEFKIHEGTVKVLTEMAERCVLGVRGYYAAEILNKHGIKNISVIGCPSLYLNGNRNFTVKNCANPKNISSNFRAFHGVLKHHETEFLKYCASNKFSFVEQNQATLTKEMCGAKDYAILTKWLSNCTHIFFSATEWIDYYHSFNFNIGYRFHANVAALHAAVPSLYLTPDSRVSEMCEFFKLPTIKPEAFDPKKSIDYYANLADYSDFNANYASAFDNFVAFCKCNDVPLHMKNSIEIFH